jgi:hypothetical protein
MKRVGLLVTVLAVTTAATVEAAPVDRSTFVRRADAICKPTISKAVPLLQDGLRYADQGNTDAAAKKFVKAYRLFRGAYQKIGKLNRPAQDTDRIRKWVDLTLRGTGVGVDSVQALRVDQLQRALRLSKRTLKIFRKAHHVVAFWGFQYCV